MRLHDCPPPPESSAQSRALEAHKPSQRSAILCLASDMARYLARSRAVRIYTRNLLKLPLPEPIDRKRVLIKEREGRAGRSPMMKYRMVCFSVVALVLLGLAPAQSSQPRSSSAKSSSGPLSTATQPLTPKS